MDSSERTFVAPTLSLDLSPPGTLTGEARHPPRDGHRRGLSPPGVYTGEAHHPQGRTPEKPITFRGPHRTGPSLPGAYTGETRHLPRDGHRKGTSPPGTHTGETHHRQGRTPERPITAKDPHRRDPSPPGTLTGESTEWNAHEKTRKLCVNSTQFLFLWLVFMYCCRSRTVGRSEYSPLLPRKDSVLRR